jgi:hypothetical protein
MGAMWNNNNNNNKNNNDYANHTKWKDVGEPRSTLSLLPTPSVASDLLEVESIYKLVEVTKESSVQFHIHWQQHQEDPQPLL